MGEMGISWDESARLRRRTGKDFRGHGRVLGRRGSELGLGFGNGDGEEKELREQLGLLHFRRPSARKGEADTRGGSGGAFVRK